MRAYVPVGWAQLAALDVQGVLPGPLRACAVDPSWRAGSPEVDEEEWEFEAQLAAAEALVDLDGGVVLAVDVPDPAPDAAAPDGAGLDGAGPDAAFDDGWVSVAGPVTRRQVAAVLTTDLAWFGVQEIPGLLDR
jgi:Family of unknown function (DUF6912)